MRLSRSKMTYALMVLVSYKRDILMDLSYYGLMKVKVFIRICYSMEVLIFERMFI